MLVWKYSKLSHQDIGSLERMLHVLSVFSSTLFSVFLLFLHPCFLCFAADLPWRAIVVLKVINDCEMLLKSKVLLNF